MSQHKQLLRRVGIAEAERARNQARLSAFRAGQTSQLSRAAEPLPTLTPSASARRELGRDWLREFVALATAVTGVEIRRVVEHKSASTLRLQLSGRSGGPAPVSFHCSATVDSQSLSVLHVAVAVETAFFRRQWQPLVAAVQQRRSLELWLRALWAWSGHHCVRAAFFERLRAAYPERIEPAERLLAHADHLLLGDTCVRLHWRVVACPQRPDEPFDHCVEFQAAALSPLPSAPLACRRVAKLNQLLATLRALYPPDEAAFRCVAALFAASRS